MILHGLFEGPVRMDSDDPLPDGPGVYVIVDGAGSVVYVGESGNLQKRTRNHRSGDPIQSDLVRKILRTVPVDPNQTTMHPSIEMARDAIMGVYREWVLFWVLLPDSTLKPTRMVVERSIIASSDPDLNGRTNRPDRECLDCDTMIPGRFPPNRVRCDPCRADYKRIREQEAYWRWKASRPPRACGTVGCSGTIPGTSVAKIQLCDSCRAEHKRKREWQREHDRARERVTNRPDRVCLGCDAVIPSHVNAKKVRCDSCLPEWQRQRQRKRYRRIRNEEATISDNEQLALVSQVSRDTGAFP